ncbi:VOC family protein [Hymenobacter gummosus]|uniref:VOC family protein n=1 Tax=Hymenobacter gummosus TaxID=1776032 RepID=A0A3S0JIX3_9BACT|nr:VOC family protein [Hymenobacter gummosus]RTQ51591.1 VOC family protein [Hymenobacter gummosus]
MQKITTFLTYDQQAEEAAKLYVGLFEDAEITNTTYYKEGMPVPAGRVMSVEFRLAGQEYVALNGGPHFRFAEGMSLFVSCQDQAEIDRLWVALTADGGQPGQCGWLKDRFGVSWQLIPHNLRQLLSSPDPDRARRKMAAMLQMHKIDIAALEQA